MQQGLLPPRHTKLSNLMLCLGLGGDISTLRRQKNAGDLVNNQQLMQGDDDEDCAEITIKLLRDNEKVYEIFCSISRSNEIYYQIGRYSTITERMYIGLG